MMRIIGLCVLSQGLVACGSAPETPATVGGEAAHANHDMADHAGHDMAAAKVDDGAGDHCHGGGEPEPTSYARTEHPYALPDLTLTDQTGAKFAVADLATSERPIALNFIFATCTTICPVMSATFARAQETLGDASSKIDFVSITIDPEHDTPAVLADYADKYGAPANWRFLTGDGHEVESVVRAFDSWKGSKFSHEPITLLHRPGQESWVRLDGLGSATELVTEIRKTLLTDPILQ